MQVCGQRGISGYPWYPKHTMDPETCTVPRIAIFQVGVDNWDCGAVNVGKVSDPGRQMHCYVCGIARTFQFSLEFRAQSGPRGQSAMAKRIVGVCADVPHPLSHNLPIYLLTYRLA